WRWVFLFNVPIGILGAAWGIWRLREPVRPVHGKSFDWFGTISLSIGLAGLLLGLSMLAFPLVAPSFAIALLIIGLISLLVFGFIEPRIQEPLIQLRMFQNRLFTLANFSGLLNGIARGAVLFLLIFFMQGPYQKDPLTA